MDRNRMRNRNGIIIGAISVILVYLVFLWGIGLMKVSVEFFPHYKPVSTVSNSTSSAPNTSVSSAQSSPNSMPVIIMIDMSYNVPTDSGLSQFAIAKAVALELNRRLAIPVFYTFAGRDLSGNIINDSSPDYAQYISPNYISLLDEKESGGAVSIAAGIQKVEYDYAIDHSAIIFITDTLTAEGGDKQLSLDSIYDLRKQHNKLIFVALPGPLGNEVDPILTSAAELTGGKVIPVDPLNIGAAVNATLDALK